jgi:myo-inositol-1(or 4)-monophosphatase
MKETLVEAVKLGGSILRNCFGRVTVTKKPDQTVVTEADLASEKAIIELIESRYPDCNIIAEESGCRSRSSQTTWIIDPLDGSANYARGVPWFGVLIAILHNETPVQAAMYLPVCDSLYLAETGKAVFCNDKRVAVTQETEIDKVLCALACIPPEQYMLLASRITCGSTASLVDYCHTVDGRTGAFIYGTGSIWDIAGLPLFLKEAGGVLTDLQGDEIRLDLGARACTKKYPHLGASTILHEQIMKLARTTFA